MNPVVWRKWHRWIGLPATLFLLFASVTGALVAGGAPVGRVMVQLKGPSPPISVFTGKPSGGEDRRFVVDATTGELLETAAYADKPLLSASGFVIYTTIWKPSRAGIRRCFW